MLQDLGRRGRNVAASRRPFEQPAAPVLFGSARFGAAACQCAGRAGDRISGRLLALLTQKAPAIGQNQEGAAKRALAR